MESFAEMLERRLERKVAENARHARIFEELRAYRTLPASLLPERKTDRIAALERIVDVLIDYVLPEAPQHDA